LKGDEEMNIDVICPLYNAEKYLVSLHQSILMQENVDLHSINYILTRCKDKTEDILKELKANYTLIEPSEFSHSTSREMMAKKCTGDIVVFISQDVKIKRRDWLYYN
jgi:rhamnosyltransferase